MYNYLNNNNLKENLFIILNSKNMFNIKIMSEL